MRTQVTKTLVIGLGTTGTRICTSLIRRLTWEYGDAARAAWIQVMAIETNNHEPAAELRERGNFYPIGLDADRYGQVLADPRERGRIHLDQWADMEVLSRVKDMEGGAGNIRMAGRLAIMIDPTYQMIKHAVVTRLFALRSLVNETLEARVPLADGATPQLHFSAGGNIRIYVVGTLCGGTGSALAPDFGYLVRSSGLSDSENVIGMFTLPHEDVPMPHSIWTKKNAYTALVELNQYHVGSWEATRDITYPDGTTASTFQGPYDLTYLLSPHAATSSAITELNDLVAQRIFLNSVNSATDPMATRIAVPTIVDRHQANVFSTFGLSVVEYPAESITQAAARRLLRGALTQWHAFKGDRKIDLTRVIGLDWEDLVHALLQRSTPEWQSEVSAAALSEAGQVRPDFGQLGQTLMNLRNSLDPEGSLGGGLRIQHDVAVESVYGRLVHHAHHALLDRTAGPQVLAAQVGHVLATLDDLDRAAHTHATSSSQQAAAAWDAVDTAFRALEAAHKRRTFFAPNRAGIQEAQRALHQAIMDVTAYQLTRAVSTSLRGDRTTAMEPGVIERLRRLLVAVQTNLSQLDARMTAVIDQLASEEAVIGAALAFPGRAVSDARTWIRDEYVRALLAGRNHSTETLDDVEARWFETLIAGWLELPPVIVPLNPTWISEPFDPGSDRPVPCDVLQRLVCRAAQPFHSFFARENVLERLHRDRQINPAVDQHLLDAARKAYPSVLSEPFNGSNDNRKLILESRSLGLPVGTSPDAVTAFKEVVSSVFPPNTARYLTTPDPTAVFFLHEFHYCPLRAFDKLLGHNGLQAGVPDDMPTFHTRRDVLWCGLSDHDVQARAEATEAIIAGVLLNEVTVEHDLRFAVTPQGFGHRSFRRLPANLPAAAHMLASGATDLDGHDLTGALGALLGRIKAHVAEQAAHASPAALAEMTARALEHHTSTGVAARVRGWGDETWAREQLERFVTTHLPAADARDIDRVNRPD